MSQSEHVNEEAKNDVITDNGAVSQVVANETTVAAESTTTTTTLWQKFFKKIRSTKFRVAFVTFTWGLLTGIERVIVVPTLWLYFFTKFDQTTALHYYGLTLGAFNLSVLLFTPVYGLLANRGVAAKTLLLISNQFEVVGNVVYFISNEPWLILMGRFIAGIGAGSEVPLAADVVRVTTEKERTQYVVALLIGKQFGLIVGPALTLFMQQLKVDVGQVHVNVYNAPGMLMACLWTLHTILTLFIYKKVDQPPDKNAITTFEPYHDFEKLTPPPAAQWLNWRVFILMTLSFTAYFNIMSLEAILTPTTIKLFKWTEVQTSIVYLICGVFVILVFGIVHSLSFHCADRHLLSFGMAVLLIAYLFLTLSIGILKPPNHVNALLTIVLFGVALHVIGQPFLFAASESLFTKCVSVNEMDIAQSVFRTVNNFAFLLGTLFGGVLVSMPQVVFTTMFLILFIPSILFRWKFY